MKPLAISVAMATYNGSRFISDQLESLAAQETLPTELVISDDGSSDGTPELIEAFGASAPFAVHVHRNDERLGVLRNFERALSLCSGDIVFLSDQDDVWLPSKIESVIAVFHQRPDVLAVINDKIITDDDLSPSGATMLGNIRSFGSPDSCFVAGCCSAFRREWLDIAMPIPEGPPAHDSWLVGLAHRLDVIAIQQQPLQYYRRHGHNVSENAYSEPRSLTLLDRLRTEVSMRAEGPADRDAYWDSFLRWHEAEIARISEKRVELESLGLRQNAEAALKELSELRRAINQRRKLAHLGPLRRVGAAWSLWWSRGYEHFSGWKSAMKDAIGKS